MTPNMQMEQMSLAYIRSVAAHAGYQVVRPDLDFDSIDGVILDSSGRRPKIEFQAKATTRGVLGSDIIRFQLPVKNYDDLRLETINPRILVVLIMPQGFDDWVTQTDDELCLRHCAYWMSLRGLTGTTNQHTVTVHVPLVNMFDSGQLTGMMQRTERMGAP